MNGKLDDLGVGVASAPDVRLDGKQAALAWLRQAAPTLLVLILLAVLAYAGHFYGWKLDNIMSGLGGSSPEKEDWCEKHGVPDSVCVECHVNLMPRQTAVWCRTHRVHNCPLERPEIAQLKSPPVVTQADLDRAQRALALKERPDNNSKSKLAERRVQMVSLEAMNKMGLDIRQVVQDRIVEFIPASGEIAYEQPRVAPHFTAVAGRVWYVTDKGIIGAQVKRGDVLALVDAVEVGKAKSEFLQAYAQLELKARTMEASQGVVPPVRQLELNTALREAQIRLVGAHQSLLNLGLPVPLEEWKNVSSEEMVKRLHFFGVPDSIAATLSSKTTTSNLIPILASRDGKVTSVKVVAGEMVDPARPLFIVADTSHMWLTVNVRLEDVKYLRIRDAKTGTPGQTVHFRPDGRDLDVAGELVWLSTEVDEKTRTVPVRAEVPNTDGTLLANTFGTCQIILREEKDALVVPTEAVHWADDCHVVFVRDKNFFEEGAPKVFHVRTVRPGVRNDGKIEIIAGLAPGEVVATRNSAVLRAELLKNKLGEGCCH